MEFAPDEDKAHLTFDDVWLLIILLLLVVMVIIVMVCMCVYKGRWVFVDGEVKVNACMSVHVACAYVCFCL